jgi:two-component system KDP operon response regulator KdpE
LSARILIVDDEPQIVRMLRASLQSSGYDVVSAGNGLEGFTVFEASKPDLVITDMSMPQMDGLGLVQEIRRIADTPIIVLSVRGAEPIKIDTLDAGADDYVTKPFNMPELLARVRAHLRRETKDRDSEADRLNVGDFVIDIVAHTVMVRGESLHLTPKEFDLLVIFARNAEKALTHRVLARSVWGASGDSQTENLRVLVAQLRRKIDTPGKHYIQSEPWVGYRFQPA